MNIYHLLLIILWLKIYNLDLKNRLDKPITLVLCHIRVIELKNELSYNNYNQIDREIFEYPYITIQKDKDTNEIFIPSYNNSISNITDIDHNNFDWKGINLEYNKNEIKINVNDTEIKSFSVKIGLYHFGLKYQKI